MTNKYFLIIILLFLGALIFYISLPEDKKILDRNEGNVEQLSKEMRQAIKSGNEKKVAEIEKEVIRQLPEGFQALYEIASNASTTIELHGIVVDQNNNPVTNASIKYLSTGLHQLTRGGNGTVKTDNNGQFEINAEGYHLTLYAPESPVIADAYFPPADKTVSPRKQIKFTTGSNDNLDWSLYTKNNPFKVTVWRQGEFEDIQQGGSNRLLTPDGVIHTFIDSKYLDNAKYKGINMYRGNNFNGYLYFSCDREGIADERRIIEPGDWSITITAIDGGIQQADEYSLNMAPLDGYLPSITEAKLRSDSHYSKSLEGKKYFFTSNNGKTYGSLIVSFRPFSRKDSCLINVKYKINNNSSRNLAVRENIW